MNKKLWAIQGYIFQEDKNDFHTWLVNDETFTDYESTLDYIEIYLPHGRGMYLPVLKKFVQGIPILQVLITNSETYLGNTVRLVNEVRNLHHYFIQVEIIRGVHLPYSSLIH